MVVAAVQSWSVILQRRDAEEAIRRRSNAVAPSYHEIESRLRPLAEHLPAPRPGDWLAEHHEPGQTFDEYLDARPVRRSNKLNTIYVSYVGDFTEAQQRILDLTRDYLAIF